MRTLLLLCLPCVALQTACLRTAENPPAATATPLVSPPSVAAAAPSLVATSPAARGGLPRLLRAAGPQPAPAGLTPLAAARFHLERHAAAFGRTPAALRRTELRHVHDTGRGGLVVTLGQRAHGLEIYRGDVKVLLHRDHALAAVSGALLPAPAEAPVFAWSREDALAATLAAEYRAPLPALVTVTEGEAPGGFHRVALARPVDVPAGRLRLGKPARVKPVLYLEHGRPRPAYFVELFAGTGDRAFADALRFLVAADDLEILERRDLTHRFRYRVWADADGRPADGPLVDFTPHPSGRPDGSGPTYAPSRLIDTDGFNHNAAGQPDPWLAPDATETRGNNVDAYADLAARDGFTPGDLRASVSEPGAFDRTFDPLLAVNASQAQMMAGLVQAFYVTNWMHDWYYDSGFDEAAGNPQRSNYGRGGLEGDPLLMETLDYGGRDNSDMQAASDGESPRMQAYYWSGTDSRSLQVQPLDRTLATGPADFGLATFDLIAEVALASGSAAALNDACGRVSPRVSGRIALVDRGTCTFKQKAVNVAAAGAVGMILANNVTGGPMPMSDGTPAGAVNLGILSVSLEDGAALRAALAAGTLTAHLRRVAGLRRDGALDSTVVAHEWGHLLHLRLADCGANQCAAMSEGWGDFLALHLVVREGDELRGAFALAIHAAGGTGEAAYFGIRRAPYSLDFAKNPFTFRFISDEYGLPRGAPLQDVGSYNSEVHAAGEVWTQALFEAYGALLAQTTGPGATRSFEEVRRAMSDYVVASLKLTPPDATYTEARDALLAAAAAQRAEDVPVLAAAFARRGLGSCAASPDRGSTDFSGVVESFDVKPRVEISAVTLDDSVSSCNSNGTLDAGERGVLKVTVVNASTAAAAASALTVTSTNGSVRFPAGASVAVPALAPFASADLTLEVSLDAAFQSMALLPFELTLRNEAACTPAFVLPAAFRTNFQELSGVARSDAVETVGSLWTPGGRLRDYVWARREGSPGNHEWHGEDLGSPSDTWLESPTLRVSEGVPFRMSFDHSHDFEVGEGESGLANYDGAVIELSTNGGVSWTDVSAYADPGYGGSLDTTSGNPLAGRQALVGRNPSYPAKDRVVLDFGDAFAGQSVRVRFRIGTDAAAGGAGWALDNLGFGGIDNTPFGQLARQPSQCYVADAPALAQAPFSAPASGGGCAASGEGPGLTAAALLVLGALALRRRRTR